MGATTTVGAAAFAVLDPGGSAAREIDRLWWLLLATGTVALLLVVGALAIGLRRSSAARTDAPVDRRAHADQRRDGPAATSLMVAGGLVLPVVAIVIVLVATIASMRAMDREVDADALTIEVTGHQWWWEIRYPGAGVVTANEIHIPAGTPVRLELRSADVVHSFWVPDLAGKLDLIPERVNELVIDADEPGTYLGQCAEFCGVQHANMAVVVVAHDAAGYDEWIDAQSAPAVEVSGAAADGLRTFVDRDCASCHTIAGTPADGSDGPDLTHVASREFIAGGLLEPVVPDLRAWIEDPHAIKPGTKMPVTELSAEEVDRLIAYLETLR